MHTAKIRAAAPADCQAIYNLICELAAFERAADKVTNSPSELLKDGFGEFPLFVCFVAEMDNEIVGMSFCYTRYSTWIGKVLYLEDLVVTEKERNRGIGLQLFQYTIEYAKRNHFKRVCWQVLDWNEPAIAFYKKTGASFDDEWLNVLIDL